jgi:thioredoxin-dependent peroxiredoxin
VVLGVSVDDHKTQCDFAAQTNVTFPLVGDSDKNVSKLYGVLWPFIRMDRRVTYVIDKEGVVRATFHHEFQISKHLDDVLRLLERLETRTS